MILCSKSTPFSTSAIQALCANGHFPEFHKTILSLVVGAADSPSTAGIAVASQKTRTKDSFREEIIFTQQEPSGATVQQVSIIYHPASRHQKIEKMGGDRDEFVEAKHAADRRMNTVLVALLCGEKRPGTITTSEKTEERNILLFTVLFTFERVER